jgi:outer membrane protein assembly factor BamB
MASMRIAAARLMPFLGILAWAGTGNGQTTAIREAASHSLRTSRLSPAWGWHAYTNDLFAYHPRDFGQCLADAGSGAVYCGTKSGLVAALSASTGAVLWTFQTRSAVRARPVLGPEGLFAGSSDGCVYRLDPVSGTPLFKAPYCTDAAVYGDLALADDTVYFAVSINKVYAISAKDGTFRWEAHRDRPQFMSIEGVASPVPDGDRVLAGFSDGMLQSLDRANGGVGWSIDLSGGRGAQRDVDATPVVSGDVVYSAAFADGPAAVSVRDGKLLWRGRWSGASRPVVTDRFVYAGTADGEVLCLQRETGAARFVTRLEKTAASAPLLVRDILIVAGDRGLWTLDALDGFPLELLSIPYGAREVTGGFRNRVFFLGGGGTVNAADVLPR